MGYLAIGVCSSTTVDLILDRSRHLHGINHDKPNNGCTKKETNHSETLYMLHMSQKTVSIQQELPDPFRRGEYIHRRTRSPKQHHNLSSIGTWISMIHNNMT